MAGKMNPNASGPNNFAPPTGNVTKSAQTKTYGGAKDPGPWAKGPNDSGNSNLGNQGADATVKTSS